MTPKSVLDVKEDMENEAKEREKQRLENINSLILEGIPTKDLVEVLSKRFGVKAYKAEFDSRYSITVKDAGLAEDGYESTTKEDTGPAIILEVID